MSGTLIFALILLFSFASLTTAKGEITLLAETDVTTQTGTAYDLEWTPDGEMLTVASGYEITLYDESLEEPLLVWEPGVPCLNIAWNPDSTQLAIVSGFRDSTVTQWNWDAASQTFEREKLLRGNPPQSLYAVSWSPDGSMIASMDTDEAIVLQIWDAQSGRQEATLELPYTRAVSNLIWNADATTITGIGQDAESEVVLFSADISTGEHAPLLTIGETVYAFDISPDSNLLATINEQGLIRVWWLPTGEEIVNFQSIETPAGIAWRPDGTKLAVLGYETALQLWDVSQLHIPAGADPTNTSVDQLLFVSNGEGSYDIFVMDADGENIQNLTNTPDIDEFVPQWSPDGTQIAFVIAAGADSDLYLMDADGSNIRQLTDNGGFNEVADWSPDGKYLVFTSDRDGVQDGYLLEIATGEIQNFTDNEAQREGGQWLRTGEIVFGSDYEGNPDIYIMNGDGSNLRKLTDDRANDGSAQVSPDGTLIAFVSTRDGGPDVFVMDINGENVRNLTNHRARDYALAWLPDSQYIAFRSDRDGNAEIYITDLDGNITRRLTDNPADDAPSSWHRK